MADQSKAWQVIVGGTSLAAVLLAAHSIARSEASPTRARAVAVDASVLERPCARVLLACATADQACLDVVATCHTDRPTARRPLPRRQALDTPARRGRTNLDAHRLPAKSLATPLEPEATPAPPHPPASDGWATRLPRATDRIADPAENA